jgi:hypothetical protein
MKVILMLFISLVAILAIANARIVPYNLDHAKVNWLLAGGVVNCPTKSLL